MVSVWYRVFHFQWYTFDSHGVMAFDDGPATIRKTLYDPFAIKKDSFTGVPRTRQIKVYRAFTPL